jgi:hypothetical protein
MSLDNIHLTMKREPDGTLCAGYVKPGTTLTQEDIDVLKELAANALLFDRYLSNDELQMMARSILWRQKTRQAGEPDGVDYPPGC